MKIDFTPTSGTDAEVSTDGLGDNLAKIGSVKEDSNKLVVTLVDKFLFKLEVERQASWTDKSSKRNFPFKAALTSADGEAAIPGGCQSVKLEPKLNLSVMRYASSRGPSGTAVLGAWMGEGGENRGFKIEETVVLPSGSTYASLQTGETSSLTCTLAAGQYLVPSLNDKPNYVSLNIATRFKATTADASVGIQSGDPLTVLGVAGIDRCYVDKGNEVVVTACPENSSPVANQKNQTVTAETGAPLGDYVLTQCEEGHGTWIPATALEKRKGVKPIFLGF
jgi:hypothetical protein